MDRFDKAMVQATTDIELLEHLRSELDDIVNNKEQVNLCLSDLNQQINIKQVRYCYLEGSEQESQRIAADMESSALALANEILMAAETEVSSLKAELLKAEEEIALLQQELDSLNPIVSERQSVNQEIPTTPLSSNLKHNMIIVQAPTVNNDNTIVVLTNELGLTEEKQVINGQGKTMDLLVESPKAVMDDSVYNMKLVAFLNAKHYMLFAGKKGVPHGHSWQFQVEAAVYIDESNFVKFEDLDRHINQMLAPYQRSVLNEVPPFTEIEPLTENIAAVFYNRLEEEFADRSVKLLKLTVWENPTKGIEITQRLPQFFTINGPVKATDLMAKSQIEAAAVWDEAKQAADDPDSLKNSANNEENEKKRADIESVNKSLLSVEDTSSNPDRKMEMITQINLPESNHPESADASSEIDAPADSVTKPKQPAETPGRHYPIWQYIIALLAIAGVAIWAYWPILTASPDKIYPVGLDTWGHLYKAEFLYKQILIGNYYPRFTADWYNGCQLFRYWAPLPYYFIALLRFCSTNIFVAGNIYMFICALLGGIFCLFWAKQINLSLATLLGMIWVIWPNNLKIALAEGNYPRTLTTAFLPLIFWAFYLIINGKRTKSLFIFTIILVHILVLCHAMMAAIYCICFMLFAIILWFLGGCSFKDTLYGFLALVLGIISSSWWLIPSLKGGIAGMGKVAAAGAVEFIPLTISFNPFNRFKDPGSLYFGMILLIIILLYFFIRPSKPIWAKSLFWVGLFCIIITFPTFSWIHQLLPLSEILWPLRFTTFASFALLLCGFAFSNEYLKSPSRLAKIGVVLLLTAFFAINFVDNYFSIEKLVRTQSQPSNITRVSEKIKASSGWRIAAIDLSSLSSIPSYLLSFQAEREQVFGWAWQGATTAQNIMLLNTALENNLYPFLFRQVAQLGATDLIVKNSMVKKPQYFDETANLMGFNKVMTSGEISYWHSLQQKPYLQLNKEACLAIGSHASIYALQFPMIEIGQLNNPGPNTHLFRKVVTVVPVLCYS